MPAGGALFGSSASGPGSTGGNKHLVEMRAGKMNLKGRMVSHYRHCRRRFNNFPDDCEYVKIPQCTTGRAYLLKFKSSNKKFFFWLQEPRADKDDDNCKRINELLNNPSSAVQSTPNPDQDLQSLLNNMSQSQLMQLFGGAGQMGVCLVCLALLDCIHPSIEDIQVDSFFRGPNSGSARTSTTPAITHRTVPSTPTTTTTTNQASPSTGLSTPQNAPIPPVTPDAPSRRSTRPADATPGAANTNSIRLSDLQSFLQGLTPPIAQPQDAAQQQSVDLSTALTSDALSGILSNPEALQQLQGHLPAVDGTAQESLRSTLASPQFQQAVSQFSSALESGQLGPVVSQLAVNPEAVAAAAQGNMQDFVKALEKGGSSAEGGSSDKKDKEAKKDNKKDDDDEQMQLD
ncbi:hypothetical protein NQ318_010258 [Aromia moschata]|uniref:Adhesion regulating molecule 1 n=1 Tax=Aromia moschata TaxID=1265417 RepID=A0AAV8YKM5_9CUCU|nr:hypothetical protein NQ318_010258 [Aromia moschata]